RVGHRRRVTRCGIDGPRVRGLLMDFRLPELGEGVYEAELVSWLVKVGDSVKRGQNLMEVLTDKASMEVPSPFAGSITDLRAEPGQPIKVGNVVLTYAPTGQPETIEDRGSRIEDRKQCEDGVLKGGDGNQHSDLDT